MRHPKPSPMTAVAITAGMLRLGQDSTRLIWRAWVLCLGMTSRLLRRARDAAAVPWKDSCVGWLSLLLYYCIIPVLYHFANHSSASVAISLVWEDSLRANLSTM